MFLQARDCCSISVHTSEGSLTADTVGAATSKTLSANSASLSRLEVSGVDAKTILTLGGNLCKNSSLKKELSAIPGRSPMSCCILLRSCVGSVT